ncbi:hypothetical protein [Thermogutta sp.]|uniref:hypothetical protein n=1 Tax=Thermogutta sp. TaxID=1962930 RepID=UPI003C7D4EE9
MLKKFLIAGGLVVLIGTFLLGRDLVSYVRTSARSVQEAVVDAVPTEFQIRRARDMIEDLLPQIRQNMHLIAREEVEIERLDRQIAQAREALEQEKAVILRMKNDLANGKPKLVYCGREYSAEQVRQDLANRFERYKTNEATLANLEQIRDVRLKSLQAARDKMENMLAAKRQLEVEVENLQARLQMVQAAQATSAYQFDDSKLGRIKELIADLRTRLDVAERLVQSQGLYQGEIPVENPNQKDIVDEVTEYFGNSGESQKVPAVAKAH